jgi:RNase P/RNase MRP subunit p30
VLDEGAIYRLRMPPSHAVNYPYLVVSDNVGEPADILTIRDFKKVKKGMNKKLRKGTGLEMMISPARKMDSISLAKWFGSLADLYNFCHWSRCQFIISSGATSKYEMISGPCLDAILKTLGIEPQNYWSDLSKWLEQRLARNVYYAKEAT